MAKTVINYFEIDWDKLDFSRITYVKNVCIAIKEHYWTNRPAGQMRSQILESGKDYDFLIKAFETYHTEWLERTYGATQIGFFVAIPEKQKLESAKCFHLVLDGTIPEDSAISHNFTKIDKSKADIIKCCREAIRYDKSKLKLKYIKEINGNPISDGENIHIHHNGIRFSEIARKWIEVNGGVEALYPFVNSSVGNGTITKFTSKEVENSFREFHNEFSCLIPLTKEEHKEIHRRK